MVTTDDEDPVARIQEMKRMERQHTNYKEGVYSMSREDVREFVFVLNDKKESNEGTKTIARVNTAYPSDVIFELRMTG